MHCWLYLNTLIMYKIDTIYIIFKIRKKDEKQEPWTQLDTKKAGSSYLQSWSDNYIQLLFK